MRKFILIDSNIAGQGGHYLEYAEQILEIAAEAGFSCHVMTNRAFKPKEGHLGYTSYPVFEYDMWGKNISLALDKGNEFSEADRRYLNFHYSRTGLLWQAAEYVESVHHYSQHTTLPATIAKRLGNVYRFRSLTERQLNHLPEEKIPPASHSEARKRQYHRLHTAACQIQTGEIPSSVKPNPVIEQMAQAGAAADCYAEQIIRVLANIEITAEDVIFIPTLSLAEARSVRDLLRRSSVARRPAWALLFRRDIYSGYSPHWSQQEWAVHEARNLFASFLRLPDSCRLSFLTDTDMLTKQYNRLNSVPFNTTAVPVRMPELQTEPQANANKRLKVVLLRDSHSDHGISYLAQILEKLDPSELQTLHFAVPAESLNVDASGDTAWQKASIARLRPYKPDVVTILDKDVPLEQIISDADICIAIEPLGLRKSQLAKSIKFIAYSQIVALENSTFIQSARAQGCIGLAPFSEGMTAEETGENVLRALRYAIGLAADQTREMPAWTIGYLGDARAEKGFHQLPVLISKLIGRTVAGRRIRVAAQVFHPDPASDIRMLKAMEKIKQLPLEYRDIHPDALASEDYLKLISRSDIIHNAYKQENYISRSSGIFVEALAARKPVITTAGTWMSGLMGDWSKPYHDWALEKASIIDRVDYSPPECWRALLGDNPSSRATIPNAVAPGVARYIIAERAEQSTHVRIEIDMVMSSPDHPICVTIAWRNEAKKSFQEDLYYLNSLNGETLSLLLPAPALAEDLWLGLTIGTEMERCEVCNLSISWLDSPKSVASFPGGLMISGDERLHPQQLKEAAIAICDNYEGFRTSCDWIWDRWTKNQNVKTLMDDILAGTTSHLPSDQRFQGGDW
ncbi:MAG TPA: hypothetical protein VJ734_05875 [Nitrosospira sp.]|nr:hypothetical protein [Nitrosospira sp.]